jgi:hypothetical protein
VAQYHRGHWKEIDRSGSSLADCLHGQDETTDDNHRAADGATRCCQHMGSIKVSHWTCCGSTKSDSVNCPSPGKHSHDIYFNTECGVMCNDISYILASILCSSLIALFLFISMQVGAIDRGNHSGEWRDETRVVQPCSRNAADLNDGSECLCQHGQVDITRSHWSCCGGTDSDTRECVLDELIEEKCTY